MRRIKTFSKLPEEAKAKLLEQLNYFIKECTEGYKTMTADYDEIHVFKDDVIYDVKKEFYHEQEAISIHVMTICDDYNFEWEEFNQLSAIIGVMICSTPIEDIELHNRVKTLLEEFKSKYYGKEN